MADYTIKGKDGKTRRFVGLDKPPSPEELDAIEQSEVPKAPIKPISEMLAEFATDAVAHPFESVIPKDTQLKVASKIAGSEQQPVQSNILNEISHLFGDGGTVSAFMKQPMAAMRGGLAGAAEGAMDQLSPFQIAASTVGEELPSFGKGFGPITRAAGRTAASTVKRGVQAATDAAGAVLPEGIGSGIIPDLVGVYSPRIKNALKLAEAGRAAAGNSAIPAELREVYEALKSSHGDTTATNWLKKQMADRGVSSAAQDAAGAVKTAGGSTGAQAAADAATANPATFGKPSPVNDGPWRPEFTRTAEASPATSAPPQPQSGGQPVMPKSEPAPAPRPAAEPSLPSGETEAQWRQRMQERINSANDAAKGAKTPTRGAPKAAAAPVADAAASPKAAIDASLKSDIDALTRKYGADRVGQITRPDAPAVGAGNAIRAGGDRPSWMPDVAQQALMRDLKAGATKDPSKTLRALSQLLKEYERNGSAANSPVAKDLATLLKNHGFKIPE